MTEINEKEVEAAREVLEQYVYDEGGCEVERVPAMVREMLEAAAEPAMNAREVIARHLCKRAGQGWSGISLYERGVYRTRAHNILAEVDAAGFTIMSKEDVEAVREKALEEAAEIAQYIPTPADVQDHALRLGYISASQAIATAIRALKSGGE